MSKLKFTNKKGGNGNSTFSINYWRQNDFCTNNIKAVLWRVFDAAGVRGSEADIQTERIFAQLKDARCQIMRSGENQYNAVYFFHVDINDDNYDNIYYRNRICRLRHRYVSLVVF